MVREGKWKRYSSYGVEVDLCVYENGDFSLARVHKSSASVEECAKFALAFFDCCENRKVAVDMGRILAQVLADSGREELWATSATSA